MRQSLLSNCRPQSRASRSLQASLATWSGREAALRRDRPRDTRSPQSRASRPLQVFILLAVLGTLATSGVASAQQPQYPPQPNQGQPQPQYQLVQQPTYSPGAVAATPVQPTSGVTVLRGSGGCSNCGSTPAAGTGAKSGGFTMSNVFGGNCAYGYTCQNGCGSLKSVTAFQFGTCSQFFAPCGPTCGGLYRKCGTTAFAAPYGTGFQCPRPYDTYANH